MYFHQKKNIQNIYLNATVIDRGSLVFAGNVALLKACNKLNLEKKSG